MLPTNQNKLYNHTMSIPYYFIMIFQLMGIFNLHRYSVMYHTCCHILNEFVRYIIIIMADGRSKKCSI